MDDLLIIEAATYPRRKVCGGGVTFHGEEQLQDLDIHIDVPAFPYIASSFVLDRVRFRPTPPTPCTLFSRKNSMPPWPGQ
ncbi:MAG: hypothetical protein R2856_24890 [Caldilineaceae bacterium]